jgi:hypothetical protein
MPPCDGVGIRRSKASRPGRGGRAYQAGLDGALSEAEAGTAACTPARAAWRAASLVWSSEVFITVPPSPLRPSRVAGVAVIAFRAVSRKPRPYRSRRMVSSSVAI